MHYNNLKCMLQCVQLVWSNPLMALSVTVRKSLLHCLPAAHVCTLFQLLPVVQSLFQRLELNLMVIKILHYTLLTINYLWNHILFPSIVKIETVELHKILHGSSNSSVLKKQQDILYGWHSQYFFCFLLYHWLSLAQYWESLFGAKEEVWNQGRIPT